MNRLLTIVTGLSIILLGLLIAVYMRFGGGRLYTFATTAPLLPADAVRPVIAYPEPIGNVAATPDSTQPTRVFFTVHPESHPEHHKLLEIRQGKAIPYPNEAAQPTFATILGLYAD